MDILLVILIVAVVLRAIVKQAHISNAKGMFREEEQIARKYGATGYHAHLMKHQVTPEKWAQYQAAVNAMKKRRGY